MALLIAAAFARDGVDRHVLAGLRPEATRLGEALTALAAAAVTLRVRVAHGA